MPCERALRPPASQVVNLHFLLAKAAVKSRPSVLWCYKKELGFTSHRKKRIKQIKKMVSRGLIDPDKARSAECRGCRLSAPQPLLLQLSHHFSLASLRSPAAVPRSDPPQRRLIPRS